MTPMRGRRRVKLRRRGSGAIARHRRASPFDCHVAVTTPGRGQLSPLLAVRRVRTSNSKAEVSMRRIVCLLGLLALVLCPRLTWAQGIMIPERRPIAGAYAVKSINIDVNVKDQVAQVQLSQVFQNVGSTNVEVEYL